MSNRPNHHARVSLAQLKTIVNYLEQNPDLARGRARTSEGNHRTKVQWHELARKLNVIKGGVVKSSKAWAKYWADKKCLLKKALIKRNRQLKKGTAPVGALYLSPLDVRLVAILNLEELVNETVDPLPYNNMPVEKYVEDNDELPSPQSDSPQSLASSVADEVELPLSPSSPPSLSQAEIKAERLSQSKRNLKWERRPSDSQQNESLQSEFNRLASMEEKRIAAEIMVANAQKESSAALAQCAAALETLAGAIRSQGLEIAEALRANGQAISEALQAQGRIIAEALRR